MAKGLASLSPSAALAATVNMTAAMKVIAPPAQEEEAPSEPRKSPQTATDAPEGERSPTRAQRSPYRAARGGGVVYWPVRPRSAIGAERVYRLSALLEKGPATVAGPCGVGPRGCGINTPLYQKKINSSGLGGGSEPGPRVVGRRS
jgi:hypothetical protein